MDKSYIEGRNFIEWYWKCNYNNRDGQMKGFCHVCKKYKKGEFIYFINVHLELFICIGCMVEMK